MQINEISTVSVVKNLRSRGRPRAFDRDEALGRAMRVFWAVGYDGASIPMLTESMEISAQSLYAAFKSKSALYEEALELYRSTIGGFAARALDEETDALDAVARLLREAAVNFALTVDTPGCMISTAPAEMADTPITIMGRALRAESVQKVAERLEQGVREGQLHTSVDCMAWAQLIGSVVLGMSVQARDGATAETLLSTAEIMVHSLRALRP